MILFGTDEPVTPMRRLMAGPLSADLDRGNLRYIRWGGREIVRAVSFVVRDTHWGTYNPKITDLDIRADDSRFVVSYRAECSGDEGIFAYAAEIEGRPDGNLVFRVGGTSTSGFATCRTGFVVLHPLAGVVGNRVEIGHASGGRSASVFPDLISPDQPFFDVRSMTHEPWPGVRVAVVMEGDPFETEDQRNWMDASYKTYIRPLAWGYPYRIEQGATVSQAVSVSIAGPVPASPQRHVGDNLRLGKSIGRVPRFGLFLPDETPAGEGVLKKTRALRPSYIVGRIYLGTEVAAEKLSGLRRVANEIDAPLALEVVIPGVVPSEELRPLAALLADGAVHLESLLVVPARDLKSRASNTVPKGEATLAAVLASARELFPSHRIGAGATVAFPELNRNRPPIGADFVTHATQGIVHAADDVSVMETLEALPDVIRTTRAIVGDVDYRLGPATIGLPPSASAVGTNAAARGRRVTLAEHDPRQRGLFAAAFAIGYAALAARHGIESVTLASPLGGSGLFDAETGSALPIAAAFAGLTGLSGNPLLEATVDGADHIAVISAETAGGLVLWLANLSPHPTIVRLGGRRFSSLLMLDVEALTTSAPDQVAVAGPPGDTVALDSYAVCCLR
ncbi:MAG TPA: hypothetical protein VG894_03765 [Bauldia sp.]|nr:hypothetical protein [Bauldia sp.]